MLRADWLLLEHLTTSFDDVCGDNTLAALCRLEPIKTRGVTILGLVRTDRLPLTLFLRTCHLIPRSERVVVASVPDEEAGTNEAGGAKLSKWLAQNSSTLLELNVSLSYFIPGTMAEPALLPSIAALPTTTVRQLGSSNVLRDPSSVVKELIDNALDARANAIFVDISANTLDSIQVKDTGHGVSAEDRPLVCRRYCTSKIRDFRDLDEIGGKWLGFRGEALASMAEMSGTMEVTTRVEGEQVAARLKYGRDGELLS
jgi:hypothetical protein